MLKKTIAFTLFCLFLFVSCRTKESSHTKDVIVNEGYSKTIIVDATPASNPTAKVPELFHVYSCKELTPELTEAFSQGVHFTPVSIVYGSVEENWGKERLDRYQAKVRALTEAKCTNYLSFTGEELKKFMDFMDQGRRSRLLSHYEWKVTKFQNAIVYFDELLKDREKLLDEIQKESLFLREIISVVREEWASRQLELDLMAADGKYGSDVVKIMRDKTKEYQFLGWTFWTSKWEEPEHITRVEYTREGITRAYAELLTALKNVNKNLSGYEGSPEDVVTMLGAVEEATKSIDSAKTKLSLALYALKDFKYCYDSMTEKQDDIFWKMMASDFNAYFSSSDEANAGFSQVAGSCEGFINRELRVASITELAYLNTPAVSYNPLLIPIDPVKFNSTPGMFSNAQPGMYGGRSLGTEVIEDIFKINRPEPSKGELIKAILDYLGKNNYWAYFQEFFRYKLGVSVGEVK